VVPPLGLEGVLVKDERYVFAGSAKG